MRMIYYYVHGRTQKSENAANISAKNNQAACALFHEDYPDAVIDTLQKLYEYEAADDN